MKTYWHHVQAKFIERKQVFVYKNRGNTIFFLFLCFYFGQGCLLFIYLLCSIFCKTLWQKA